MSDDLPIGFIAGGESWFSSSMDGSSESGSVDADGNRTVRRHEPQGDKAPLLAAVGEPNDYVLKLVDAFGGWEISVPLKPEVTGCYHVRAYSNGVTVGRPYESLSEDERDEIDYIHICDLEEHIQMLQEALAIQKAVIAGSEPPKCAHLFKYVETKNDEVTVSICQACGDPMP